MMINLSLVWIVCIFICTGICSPDNSNVPVITDLEQLSENSVKIKWTFSSLNYLLRYRIEISSDDFQNVIHEWPAQLHKIIPDTKGPVIDSLSTKSNFDCFNECIRNPFCYAASRSSNCTGCSDELNCYLKGKYDVDDHDLSADFLMNSGKHHHTVARINDFENNEAYLYNLPYNYIWKLRVSIFDQISGKWSKFSAPSDPVDIQINLSIHLHQTDLKSLQLIWKQTGNFRNYSISRYIISVSVDNQSFIDYFDSKNITTTILEPLYFESHLPEPTQTSTDNECFQICIKTANCIQYVYFSSNRLCYPITKFNPANGIEDRSAIVKSIKSTSTGFSLENLNLKSNYKVKVKYITPYGTQGESNTLTTNLIDLTTKLSLKADPNNFSIDLSWTLINSSAIRAYSVQYVMNNSLTYAHYIEKSFTDFEDPNESVFNSTIDKCYSHCLHNISCVSISWGSGECRLRTVLNQSRSCTIGKVCSVVEKIRSNTTFKNIKANTKYCFKVLVSNKYGMTGQPSNEKCYRWNVTLLNKPKNQLFNEGQSTYLHCDHNGVSIGKIQSLHWYKNGIEVEKSPNLSINYKEMKLLLNNLSHRNHNGNYTCKIILKNNQHIFSDQVEVKVNFRPVLASSGAFKNVVITQNKSINLTCSVDGYPLPTINWYINSTISINRHRVFTYHTEGTKNSWLVISNASVGDSGLYTCSIGNERSDFNVIVDYEPEFLTQSRNITVEENESIELVCSIVQRQLNKSRLVWQKLNSNEMVEADEDFKVNDRYTSILKRSNVRRNDTGGFKCFLENQPIYARTFELFVKFASYLIDANKFYEISVRKNHNIEIECTVVGYPTERITWIKRIGLNSKFFIPNRLKTYPQNMSSILSLKNVQRSDSGNYSCQLPHRAQKKIFHLIVQSVPTQPIITKALFESNYSLKLFWYLLDTGGSPLTKILLQWAFNTTTNSKDISNVTVEIDTKYATGKKNFVTNFVIDLPEESAVRILVENEIGESPASELKMLRGTHMSNSSDFDEATLTSIRIIVSVFAVLLLVILIIAFIINDQPVLEAKPDNVSAISDDYILRPNTKLTLYNSTLIESFEITTPDLFVPESATIEARRRSRHHTLQARDKRKRCKRKVQSFSNLPINGYSNESDCEAKQDSYTVETLLERMHSESLDRELHFEFLEMRNYPKNKSFKDSLKIPNERKSRYKYIYPYDDNRVKLDLIDDRPDSDFINASYIQGYSKPRKFIAAQGATKSTACDFLRMLIEKDVSIVIMLTQVYEGDPLVLKCWPYWNDTKLLHFDNKVSSRVITVENKLFYEKRLIEIRYMERSATVEHYYYKEWPDKSCPSEAQSVLNLINKMNIKCSLFNASPILVHCSAGIGRTGTYIAISNLIEMMQHEKRITPKKVVTELRKQRAFLVQNWEQYKFIHQAVLEWCLFNATLFNIDNRSWCKYRINDLQLLRTEYKSIQMLNNSNRVPSIFSFQSIIDSQEAIFKFNTDENYTDALTEDLKALPNSHLVLVRNPLLKADVCLTPEPTCKNSSEYASIVFKLKPAAIVSTSSEEENLHFISVNGQIRSKTRLPGFVILCKESDTFRFEKPNNIAIYDLEIINLNSKLSFSTIYILMRNIQRPEDTLITCDKSQIIKFTSSLIKVLNAKITSSNDSISRVIFQINESTHSFGDLGNFIALFFILQNIFKSREFDIVQTVRLLQSGFQGFFTTFEDYKFLYETCCSDSTFNMVNQLRLT